MRSTVRRRRDAGFGSIFVIAGLFLVALGIVATFLLAGAARLPASIQNVNSAIETKNRMLTIASVLRAYTVRKPGGIIVTAAAQAPIANTVGPPVTTGNSTTPPNGILPKSLPVPKSDAWGTYFLYCDFTNSAGGYTAPATAAAPTAIAWAIVSAGPYKTFLVNCSTAASYTPPADPRQPYNIVKTFTYSQFSTAAVSRDASLQASTNTDGAVIENRACPNQEDFFLGYSYPGTGPKGCIGMGAQTVSSDVNSPIPAFSNITGQTSTVVDGTAIAVPTLYKPGTVALGAGIQSTAALALSVSTGTIQRLCRPIYETLPCSPGSWISIGPAAPILPPGPGFAGDQVRIQETLPATPGTTTVTYQWTGNSPQSFTVTATSASCGAHANGSTWTAPQSLTDACTALSGAWQSGTATATVTDTFQCNSGSAQLIGQSSPSWNTSQCVAASTSCLDSQGTHPNGSQWTIPTSDSEPCSDIAGYSSGTATGTLTTTYECTNGSIGTVSTSQGSWNTSTCTNSRGGNCALQTSCPTGSAGPASCEWGTWTWGEMVAPSPLAGQFCYEAVEFASVLRWQLGSNGCCQALPQAAPCSETGQCGETFPWGGTSGPGFLNAAVASCQTTNTRIPPAPTGCPNGTSDCLVTCPSNIQ